AVDARTRARARLVRFTILDRLVRRAARAPDRRNAEGKPRPPGRLAEVLLQVRVELHQPRHDGQVRGVDELAGGMRTARVRRDADDPVAVDDDVDVGARRGALHVDEVPGVHDDAPGGD